MKTKRLLLAGLTLAAALSLGALAPSLVGDMRGELLARSGRELINQDLFAGFAPQAAAYFGGRAEGYGLAARMPALADAQAAAWLQGMGEALLQAAELRTRAERTGTVDPVGF